MFVKNEILHICENKILYSCKYIFFLRRIILYKQSYLKEESI